MKVLAFVKGICTHVEDRCEIFLNFLALVGLAQQVQRFVEAYRCRLKTFTFTFSIHLKTFTFIEHLHL